MLRIKALLRLSSCPIVGVNSFINVLQGVKISTLCGSGATATTPSATTTSTPASTTSKFRRKRVLPRTSYQQYVSIMYTG
jgi:hypothetical protein